MTNQLTGENKVRKIVEVSDEGLEGLLGEVVTQWSEL